MTEKPPAIDEDELFVFEAIEIDPERCGFRQTPREPDKPRLLVVRKDSARWNRLLYDTWTPSPEQ